MTTIVTRSGKGSALTNTEIDTNFSNLNSFKVEQTAGTGAAIIPGGTTAQRPGSPAAGHLRFNSDDGTFEGHNGTDWGPIGGGTATGDTAATPDTVAQRDGNADLYATNFVSTSDQNLKENITPIYGALNTVCNLEGVKFTWKENPDYGIQIGFIAQQVRTFLPEVVKESEEGLKVNYPVMVALLVEAVKELEAKVKNLEAK
jgi:hypothetical protein